MNYVPRAMFEFTYKMFGEGLAVIQAWHSGHSNQLKSQLTKTVFIQY
jgi:hypothetical protein